MDELKPGDQVMVNGLGDLYMDYDARPFMNRVVEFVKVTKAGLYQVRLADGRTYSFAKRNIDRL